MAYRCGPTAIGSRASWALGSPLGSPLASPLDKPFDKSFKRPLSGNYDRIFNAFERTNTFEYISKDEKEERHTGHGEIVVNRKGSSLERADCALAAHAPLDDEDFYREKVLYAQQRQLFPLQEDLADWINKTIGITYLTGENFLEVLDNGVELCQLAAVIHDRARDAIDQGLIVGPVPAIRGRCWQRAARRSFFSRDNADNFITFCRDLGVHENLLFESDDLVLHNQPRQVILCLLEVARLATRFGVEPPGLVALEGEIALEERDSGLDSAMSSAAWQFRDATPPPDKSLTEPPPSPSNETRVALVDNADAESTRSEGTVGSSDSDVPLRPTNELDKRVQLVTRLLERGCRCAEGRCSKLLKVKKVGEGRYNIAGRNVFIRLLKGRHMMVRVGGGWDTLEHFLSRHEPCQVRLVAAGRLPVTVTPVTAPGTDPQAVTAPVTEPEKERSPTPRKHSLSSSKTSLGTISPIERTSHGTISPVHRKNSVGTIAPIGRKNSTGNISPVDRKNSTGNISPDGKNSTGTISPLDRKSISPVEKSSGKMSPTNRTSASSRVSNPRTSTPTKVPIRSRSGLSLPLEPIDARQKLRSRQSAPSFSTPATPTSRATTPTSRKAPSLDASKKSRSMSLTPKDIPKNTNQFCGTERLNQAKSSSNSIASSQSVLVRKTRSQSLATTPVNETKKFPSNALVNNGKKARSMSLAVPAGALTQAVIEESIRLSLAASIADDCKKPFLHIKAKYRSPPPREVPPR